MEDFLESTARETLLRVEPDGFLSLIDDLHSQMCAPSIVELPPSSREPSSMEIEEERELELAVGGVRCDDNSTPGPLIPQPPFRVFSTDFLDSFDLQTLTV